MAQVRAEILTPWSSTPDVEFATINAPLVALEFTLSRFSDITGQEQVPPTPNLTSVLVEADESVIEAIDADERFFLVWEEYI